METKSLVTPEAKILVTGGSGFIGKRVILGLMKYGFKNITCLVRSYGNSEEIADMLGSTENGRKVEVFRGNLMSKDDCLEMSEDAQVIYHLAAGRGGKSFPDSYLNSVVTTRNLLDACLQHKCLKRFVNVSSFTVYSNQGKPNGRVVDEKSPLEQNPALRGDPYCYAKVKQEEMVKEYGDKFGLPYVILRPGVVYGPGNEQIHGRVGLGTFGLFLHLGGSNKLPLSYVDNCAEAIVLAGIVPGINGEIYNIVDDDLPSSRRFLKLYKKNVERFHSVFVPHIISYGLCYFWEKYSTWSHGQLPNTYNRKVWYATWKKSLYTNGKIRNQLGWKQKVPTREGLEKYFESCKVKKNHA